MTLEGAADRNQDDLTMNAHQSFGDMSPREFVQLCLAENERRLSDDPVGR